MDSVRTQNDQLERRIQQSKIKKFLSQFDIAALLQAKSIGNLVRVFELVEVPIEEVELMYPMLVLEYFDGVMLGSMFMNPRYSLGFPLPEWLHAALQLTQTIAAIHKEKIIHRDLSGANILYNPRNQTVRVIDFGLSTPFPTSLQAAASDHKQLQGTLTYLSPEQSGRIGRIVDSRTDIFSLGVCLFQMLVGRLPFFKTPEMKDNLELVHLILCQVAPTPHSIKPTVPFIISSIIMKCMAKNPDLRYQSMMGLLVDLRAAMDLLEQTAPHLLASSLSTESDNALAATPPQLLLTPGDSSSSAPVTHVFQLGVYDLMSNFRVSSVLYGREESSRTLLQSFEEMMTTGHTAVAYVTGSAGSGKSSLINHVITPLMASHRVLYVSSKFEQNTRQPFGCLKQITNQVLVHFLTLPSAQLNAWKHHCLQLFAGNGALMTQMFPLLGQIIGPQPAVSDLPAQETAARLTQLLTLFMCSFASCSIPLIMLFDDIQWMDRFSLEAIEAFITHPNSRSTLVLLSARTQDEVRAASLISMLARIQQANVHVARLTMTPLTLDSINQFVSDTLHCSLFKALTLSTFILAQSKGSPLFVQQIVQALHRDGLLTFLCQLKSNQEATTGSFSNISSTSSSSSSSSSTPLILPISCGGSISPATPTSNSFGRGILIEHEIRGEWKYELPRIITYFWTLEVLGKQPPAQSPTGSAFPLKASPPMPGAEEKADGKRKEEGHSSVGDTGEVDKSPSPPTHPAEPMNSSVSTVSPPSASGVAAAVDNHMLLVLQRHVLQQPKASQEVLKAASSIGLEFSTRLLQRLLPHFSHEDIIKSLKQPLAEELIKLDRMDEEDKNSLAPANQSLLTHPIQVGGDSDVPPQDASLLMSSRGDQLQRSGEAALPTHKVQEDFSIRLSLPTDSMGGGVTLGANPFDPSQFLLSVPPQYFSFVHDKIHESVYTLVPVDTRAEMHLKIADLLLEKHREKIKEEIYQLINSPVGYSFSFPSSAPLRPSPLLSAAGTVSSFDPVKAQDFSKLQSVTSSSSLAIHSDAELRIAGASGQKNAGESVAEGGSPTGDSEDPDALTEQQYFEIANHYIKAVHKLAASESLRRDPASILLLAASKARALGSYQTALYFTKASMFLMRLEQYAPTSENSRSSSHSDSLDSNDKQQQMNEVTTLVAQDSQPEGHNNPSGSDTHNILPLTPGLSSTPNPIECPPPAPVAKHWQRLPLDAIIETWTKVPADYPLLYFLTFSRGELEYLCGHHFRSFSWFSSCLSRSTQLVQQTAIFRQLIRLKTISGDYLHALTLATQALKLLGTEIVGWKIENKQLLVDPASVVQLFDQLQHSMKKYVISETERAARRQRIKEKKDAVEDPDKGQYKKSFSSAAATSSAPVSASSASSSSSDVFSSYSTGSGGTGTDSDVNSSEKKAKRKADLMARRVIISLHRHLTPCTDVRQTLISQILNESVLAAYLFQPLASQSVSLFAVVQAVQYGLCGTDGFSFTMFGASLLAVPISHPQYVPSHAVEYGQLGLGFCWKANNQADQCRSLFANALFINSFTGHLERSLIQLDQSISIGKVVGDLQFVNHSILAAVILQQYTKSLTRWEEMLRHTLHDNSRLLNDNAIDKYCRAMLLITPSYQYGLGSVEDCRVSEEETKWIEKVKAEAIVQGVISLPLSLYAVAKAKLLLCFHHPILANESLKLVDRTRLAGHPEVVTFYFVDALTKLALIRLKVNEWQRQRVVQGDASQQQADSFSRHVSSLPSYAGPSLESSSGISYSPLKTELMNSLLLYWKDVLEDKHHLKTLAESNIRDFQCQYLLVRAEMAFTVLFAFDGGFVISERGDLEDELLPPTAARDSVGTVDTGGGHHKRFRVSKTVEEKQKKLSPSNKGDKGSDLNPTGKDREKRKSSRSQNLTSPVVNDGDKSASPTPTKRVLAPAGSALARARHAHTINTQGGTAGGQASNVGTGPSSTTLRRPHSRTVTGDVLSVSVVPRGRHVAKSILSNDPFLRDLLTARISLVYSSAAAFSISSRSSSVVGGNSEPGSSASSSNDMSGSQKRSEERSGSGSDQPSSASGLSHSSNSALSHSQSHSTLRVYPDQGSNGRGGPSVHASALRCHHFVEGLANELAARFQFYIRRPQQATNHLLIALRTFTKWEAFAVVRSLQTEFAPELADVMSMFGAANVNSSSARSGTQAGAGMASPIAIGPSWTGFRGANLPPGTHGPSSRVPSNPMQQLLRSRFPPSQAIPQSIIHRRLSCTSQLRSLTGSSHGSADTSDPSIQSMHSYLYSAQHSSTHVTGQSVGVVSMSGTQDPDILTSMTFTADFGADPFNERAAGAQLKGKAAYDYRASSGTDRQLTTAAGINISPSIHTSPGVAAVVSPGSHSSSVKTSSSRRKASDAGAGNTGFSRSSRSATYEDEEQSSAGDRVSLFHGIGDGVGAQQADFAFEKIQELDLQTILQSIQAISRELVLTHLIGRLLRIITQNSGAERVSLLSRNGAGEDRSSPEEGTVGQHEWKEIYLINPIYPPMANRVQPPQMQLGSALVPSSIRPHQSPFT